MRQPDPQPTPATPDELAALYFRGHDVPCPGCGYNRRDGTTAVCPECSHKTSVVFEQRQRSHTSTVILLICASVIVGGAVGRTNVLQWSTAISSRLDPVLWTHLSVRTLMVVLMLASTITAILSLSTRGNHRDTMFNTSIWLHVVSYPVVVLVSMIIK